MISLLKRLAAWVFPPPLHSELKVEVDGSLSTSDRAEIRIYGEIKDVQLIIDRHAVGCTGMRNLSPSKKSTPQTMQIYFQVASCNCEVKSVCEHSAAARVCEALKGRIDRVVFVAGHPEPSYPH